MWIFALIYPPLVTERSGEILNPMSGLHSVVRTVREPPLQVFTCFVLPGAKKNVPPIIERTCAFDAKIYKIVDSFFAVSPCMIWNKKIFKLFHFYFQLPSLLVEK